MHFLGLAGMPRRVPDYPDVYWAWNYVSSVGSLVSILGLLVFFCVLWEIFSETNFFFRLGNFSAIWLASGPFLQGSEGQSFYLFPRYSCFHVLNAKGLFVWRDTLLLARFFERYDFFIRPLRTVGFNQFARAIYSSTVFFNLVFRRGLISRWAVRQELDALLAALAVTKLLRQHSCRLYYFSLRAVLKEEKLVSFKC